jgi:hypothetical protein
MSVELLVAPVTQDTDVPGILHLYCEFCHPEGDVASCGEDITAMIEDEDREEAECVVCFDLELYPCEGCGA